MIESDLAERTVLITGASGFIGSHLTELLVKSNADVRLLVRYSSNLQNIKNWLSQVMLYKGDLQDKGSLFRAFKDIKQNGSPDPIIFHLAAQAHVKQSWSTPEVFIRTNIMGTLNMLEAIRETGLQIYKMSFAGSSEEYGNQPSLAKANLSLSERSPVGPVSIYGTTKVAADFLCQNYFDAYEIPVVTVRMFNNFGPRQTSHFITPTVITQALLHDKVELGSLKPRRDFLFVRDGARAHIAAALKGKAGQTYCAGFGKTISMHDWVNKIIKCGQELRLWKNTKIVINEDRFRPGNTELWWLKVDYSKLKTDTGWSPTISLDMGIETTINWYARNLRPD